MVKSTCFRSAFVINHINHINYGIFGNILRGNTLKKACVLTNGCPESQLDSARLKTYFEENGWQIVDNVKDANIILFNACGLTESSELNSINSIHNIKKQIEDNQRLIVWGCLPKIDPEMLFQTHQELSLGEREIDKLDEIIKATKSINEITVNEICQPLYRESIWHRLGKIDRLPIKFVYLLYLRLTSSKYLYRNNDSSIFYIKIATGCLGNCSYCAIKKSRGNIKSKPIDEVMDEFKAGLSLGFKEFSLLGTDLGPYGRDLGYNLADLITKMVNETGDFKIGLRNIHPLFLKQMINDLVPAFATGKIWFAGVPVESGSDRILTLMKRGYSVGEFKEGIQRLKNAHPDLLISTQILVNFPTETKKDFAESMNLFEESDFDYAEIYSFSPRPGTSAADMEGRVPSRVAYLRELRMVTKALSYTISNRLFR
jgi:threonylcarbamoyladenosine tRNA methylthiotransferase CDKAL1